MSEAEQNDDEAERIVRRSVISTSDDLNLSEQNAKVASVMQMFQENVRKL